MNKNISKILASVIVLGALATPAFAADPTPVNVNDWTEFQTAVNTYDVTTINVNADITYDGTVNNIASLRNLSINGSTVGKFLNGTNQYNGFVVDSGGRLNISGLTMRGFNAVSTSGGAIENNSMYLSITGATDAEGNIVAFEGNTADYRGGAIYLKNGNISSIVGDFKSNSANKGGAIYSEKTIEGITGDFIANHANKGGAIYVGYNSVYIKAIDDNIKFDGNYVTGSSAQGGAIYNAEGSGVHLYAADGKSITFTGNTTGLPTEAENVDGIYNAGTLNINNGTYTGTVNLQALTGGGTTNIYGGTVNANANIAQNNMQIFSGATLTTKANYLNITNPIQNAGTINLDSGALNQQIKGISDEYGTVTILENANISSNIGGEIIKAQDITNNGTINISQENAAITANRDFINNGSVTIVGDDVASLVVEGTLTNNGDINVSGFYTNNTVNNSNSSLTTNGDVISSNLQNYGEVTFNNDTKKAITLTNYGTANLNGEFGTGSGINLTQNAGIMNFSADAIASTASIPINAFTLNGGTVNIADGQINTLNINNLTLGGNANLMLDADLANETMDKLKVSSVSGSGTLKISDIKLLSDATKEKVTINLFADDDTKDLLANKVSGNLTGLKYSPIYKYDAVYDDTTGNIDFTRFAVRSGKVTEAYDIYNPAILPSPIAAQMSGLVTMQENFNEGFRFIDNFMNITNML